MGASSEKSILQYHTLSACFAWIVFLCFLVTFWFRISGHVVVTDDEPFLVGLWARISTSAYYQIFLGAGAGMVCYAVVLRLALTTGGASRIFAILAGLPWPGGGARGVPCGYSPSGVTYALAPVYDAAAIFPGLGFLGTVVGVSIAIGGLDMVVDTGDTEDLISGLRSAFDTTFFGLTFSVALSILASLVDARSQQLSAAPEVGETAETAT